MNIAVPNKINKVFTKYLPNNKVIFVSDSGEVLMEVTRYPETNPWKLNKKEKRLHSDNG